jgi:hypothetical protein
MFDFTHTEQELRLILAGLEELPHKISRALIDKLVNGAVAQQPAAPTGDVAADTDAAPSADASAGDVASTATSS